MTDDTISVDLTDDVPPAEPATLDEPETPEPDAEPRDAGTELKEAAQKQARRWRDNAEGHNARDRAEAALREGREQVQTHGKELQRANSEIKDAQNRIERLEMTRDRVEDQPPDCPIVQTVAGGISLEVPPDDEIGFAEFDEAPVEPYEDTYTRSDLVDEIDETIAELDAHTDRLEDKLEGLGKSYKVGALSCRLLQQYIEAYEDPLGEMDQRATGAAPANDPLM